MLRSPEASGEMLLHRDAGKSVPRRALLGLLSGAFSRAGEF